MSVTSTSWLARRDANRKRRPRIALRAPRFYYLRRRRGCITVVIRGRGLRPAAVPAIVTVGGKRLHELRFARDGCSLKGVLYERPASRRVVVDLGYVRGQWRPRKRPSRRSGVRDGKVKGG